MSTNTHGNLAARDACARGVALTCLIGLLALAPHALAQPADAMDVAGTDSRSEINAYLFAEISRAAYTDDGFARRSQLASAGVHEVAFLDVDEDGDTQVVLAETSKVFVVAVRGTEDWASASGIEDLWNDFQIGQYQVDWYTATDVQVHNGFDNAAGAVYSQVLARVRTAAQQGKSIFFTGHSLGGAVAQILALRCALQGYPAKGVYTYGSPRAGNAEWKRLYEARLGSITHRFINEHDDIPCMPLRESRWEFAGPAHVLGTSSIQWTPGAPVCDDREDHAIARYIAKLRAYMPSEHTTAVFRRPALGLTMGTSASPTAFGAETYRSAWNEGWLQIEPYQVNGVPFLARFKSSGVLRTQQMTSTGGVGAVVADYEIPNVMLVAASTSGSYMYFLTKDYVLIGIALKSNGALCNDNPACPLPRFLDARAALGVFATLAPHTEMHVYGSFLMLTSRYTGHTAFFDMSTRTVLYSGYHSVGITASALYGAAGRIFLFQLEEATGEVQVRRLGADMKPSAPVYRYDWTSGWTQAHFWSGAGGLYLTLIKAGTGDVKTFAMNADGSLGAQLEHKLWSIGYQTSALCSIGSRDYLFVAKR